MGAARGDTKPRILIVDADVNAAGILRSLVEEDGYVAETCTNGVAALQMARTNIPDLVLLDAVLPDLRGCEVARRLRELFGSEQFVPIIMVSGLSGVVDKTDCLAYADDYVTKPVSDAELQARIKAWLRNRRMHQDLVLSRRIYRSLYDNLPHMYVSLNARYVITWCNVAFCKAVSQEKPLVFGRPFAFFFDPYQVQSLTSYLELVGTGSTVRQEPVFTLLGTGSTSPRIVAVNAAFVGGNEPDLAVVVSMQDITARARLEEEQKIARKQLYRSARLASIGTLASGVAHEINNPLTAILGFSSALLNRIEMGEELPHDELCEYLGVINQETIRCRDIIENLSNFARERDFLISTVRLTDVVNGAVKLTLPRAVKLGGSIECRIDSGLIILADPNRLGQVLVNLISNSLDFAEAKPNVIIESSVSNGRHRQVTIRVSDNGPGIAAEVLPNVFDPFFTTKEVGKGTGLGLAMCHTIMEECNGTIDIESEPGVGTTVVLVIPVAEEETDDNLGQGGST